MWLELKVNGNIYGSCQRAFLRRAACRVGSAVSAIAPHWPALGLAGSDRFRTWTQTLWLDFRRQSHPLRVLEKPHALSLNPGPSPKACSFLNKEILSLALLFCPPSWPVLHSWVVVTTPEREPPEGPLLWGPLGAHSEPSRGERASRPLAVPLLSFLVFSFKQEFRASTQELSLSSTGVSPYYCV